MARIRIGTLGGVQQHRIRRYDPFTRSDFHCFERSRTRNVFQDYTERTMNANLSPLQLDDLYPIDQLAKAYPNLLSQATLRWQLRHRDTNGLADCCVRVGKKLLISKSRYQEWLSTRTGRAIATTASH